jgi:hypothetical protein
VRIVVNVGDVWVNDWAEIDGRALVKDDHWRVLHRVKGMFVVLAETECYVFIAPADFIVENSYFRLVDGSAKEVE